MRTNAHHFASVEGPKLNRNVYKRKEVVCYVECSYTYYRLKVTVVCVKVGKKAIEMCIWRCSSPVEARMQL